MTVYVGHIKDATTFLLGFVEELGDVDRATSREVAELQKAAHTLKGGLSAAVAELDPAIGGGAVALDLAPAGAFPLDTAKTIQEQLADLEQMDLLLDTLGYAGRVLINAKQAG